MKKALFSFCIASALVAACGANLTTEDEKWVDGKDGEYERDGGNDGDHKKEDGNGELSSAYQTVVRLGAGAESRSPITAPDERASFRYRR